ncbi:creatininase family protein [soil metagenome]
MRPYILAELNWKFIKENNFEVAVLPWGATEAHNYHLPYNTDVAQVDYVAAESARLAYENGAKVVVLPTIPFGVNTGQLDITLDINMNPSTQAAVMRDVTDSLSRQGIKKLLIMNGHGGNDFRQMIRELQVQYPDMFICTLNWFRAADWNNYFNEPGDHAGEMETSVMMHIAPDLVLPLSEAGTGKEYKFKFKAYKEGWLWAERKWSQATEDTGVGNPQNASPEKAVAYLEETSKKISKFLVELSAIDLNSLYDK